MNKIFISVVSHGHGEIISSINCLTKLTEVATVVIKNNKIDNVLNDYCINHNHNIVYLNESYGLGFGQNNNIVFNHCKSLGMTRDDFFLVLNPDVSISNDSILTLESLMVSRRFNLSAINLFLDAKYTDFDKSVRCFPTLRSFIFSFLGLGNSTIIDKSKIDSPVAAEWAAGSFLFFKASLYDDLNGFDERYFMYCEDIDICYRAKLLGSSLMYVPHVKAIHYAQHNNRKIFSKHFIWHLKSAMRFLFISYSKR